MNPQDRLREELKSLLPPKQVNLAKQFQMTLGRLSMFLNGHVEFTQDEVTVLRGGIRQMAQQQLERLELLVAV
jgi:hypothetical protein